MPAEVKTAVATFWAFWTIWLFFIPTSGHTVRDQKIAFSVFSAKNVCRRTLEN